MSLYSKYRPQNFNNLVGQDHIRETIMHEIQNGTVSHAYLFTGPRGTGKTSTARLIAKSLNCEKRGELGEPCDQCDFCNGIKDGSLIDVIEIDAASNRGIDEIRDLKEKINFAPTRAKTKTYIIDEVHMLTKEAFNALLKTLEEPPSNVYFILCTTEIHKIPETIISRCQRFDFKRIDTRTLMTRLSYIAQLEKIETEDMAIELIARHVEGGMRDAIGLLEQLSRDNKLLTATVREHLGVTGHQTVATLLDVLMQKDLQKSIHLINEVHNEGYDLTAFTREMLEYLREKLISGIQQGNNAQTPIFLAMIACFEQCRDMLRNTVIPQLPLEIAAIKICGQSKVQAQSSATAEKEPAKKVAPAPAAAPEQIPEIKETPQASAQEQATASNLKQEYDMERYKNANIKENWQRVVEHMTPPVLRRSLSSADVSEEQDGSLVLSFGSKFTFDKVKTAENIAKIEKTIEQIFGRSLKIKCVISKTEKTLEESMPASKKSEKPAKSATSSEDLAKKAMEIFSSEEF